MLGAVQVTCTVAYTVAKLGAWHLNRRPGQLAGASCKQALALGTAELS